MHKDSLVADELIWLFHERLAGSNLRNAKIAIVPAASGRWTTVTSAYERRRFPMLASNVASIEGLLQARYRLKNR
jgi:hypothetical protein